MALRVTRRRAIAKISGLGFSAFSRKWEATAPALAADAAIAAVEDAGLAKSDIDGLFVNRSSAAPPDLLTLRLQDDLGMGDLRLLNLFASEAVSALQMLHYASLAVAAGTVDHVLCVFADTPIMPAQSGGEAYSDTLGLMRIAGWEDRHGLFGAVGSYGLAMQRYIDRYGATAEQFGAVAVATREWAMLNPMAMLKSPMTIDDYLASRLIAAPIRMFDCAFPINGGAAIVVSATDAEAGGETGSAFVRGLGQGHRPYSPFGGHDNETETMGHLAAREAYRMAGIGPGDIAHAQIYDAFTYTTVRGLEDYGFCGRGEAAAFAAEGHIGPGGRLPTNTGGGQLSGYYLQGMTQLSEAVLQVTGRAEGRQQRNNDWVLVTNQGGRMDYHAAAILSEHTA